MIILKKLKKVELPRWTEIITDLTFVVLICTGAGKSWGYYHSTERSDLQVKRAEQRLKSKLEAIEYQNNYELIFGPKGLADTNKDGVLSAKEYADAMQAMNLGPSIYVLRDYVAKNKTGSTNYSGIRLEN